MAPVEDAPEGSDSLEELRDDPETWSLEQELEVAAEVYDPNRRNIHELEGEEMLERFRTMLGFDVSWAQAPETHPPEDPPDE